MKAPIKHARRAIAAVLAMAIIAGGSPVTAQQVNSTDPTLVRFRYIVNDVPAAAAFYRDQLGFTLDVQSGPYFAALSRGGVQLLLSPVTGPGGASQLMPDGTKPAPGGWARLVVNTPDLEADVARLRKAGVHFRNDIIVGLGGNQILLDDPSGNVVELFQPTAIVRN
jgi:catechol 2,3-dioxygenase-like lactoylglutathione lyase family enzyme